MSPVDHERRFRDVGDESGYLRLRKDYGVAGGTLLTAFFTTINHFEKFDLNGCHTSVTFRHFDRLIFLRTIERRRADGSSGLLPDLCSKGVRPAEL
jgi:hypothetical protein